MPRFTVDDAKEWARRGRVSSDDLRRVSGAEVRHAITDAATQKPSKYHNVKTEADGITFDSKREASRYGELKLAERAGRVRKLERQVTFPFIINDVNCGYYACDFSYDEFVGGEWRRVVEDVKSGPTKTPVYQLKKKLMKACHGIEIRETS